MNETKEVIKSLVNILSTWGVKSEEAGENLINNLIWLREQSEIGEYMLTKTKDIAEEVINKTDGLCEICYGSGEQLHHSVSGNGKRIPCQTQHSVYNLCKTCHDKVHDDRFEDLRLKFETQNRYKSMNLSDKEIIRLMGDRLYIRADVEEVFNRRNIEIDDCIVESVMKGLP